MRKALLLIPLGVAVPSTIHLYRPDAEVVIDFERGYESAFVSGFHARERAGTDFFRWTTGESTIRVEHLPNDGTLTVEARLKVLRPDGAELPFIRFTANGVTVHQSPGHPGLSVYRFDVPLRSPSLSLRIHTETFQAAGGRRLGVQALSLRATAQDERPSLLGPLLWMVSGAALFAATFLTAGTSWLVTSLAASSATGAFAYLLSRDSLRFTAYPKHIAILAAVACLAAVLLRFLFRRADWPAPRERPALTAALASTLLLKLGVLFYPLMVGSDWDFQANRLADLLQGDLFLTSVTQHQPPFHIPYPVSLYVVAAPWAMAGIDRIAVLKVVTALADVGVGLALYYFARRFLNDARAGILAVVLYQLVPINFLAFSSGNFSNLFGVATTVFFFAMLLRCVAGSGHLSAAGVFLFSVMALTSHFGTLLYGALLWPLLTAAVLWWAPAALIPPRTKLVGVAVLASLLLVGVYYLGYWDLFAGQWERVLGRQYATGGAAVGGPLAKLFFNLAFYREQLGLVFAILAVLGAVPILRRASSSEFHSGASVFVLVTLAFFTLDLTTALEVRYLLQASPLLSLFAAVYISGALARGKVGKMAGVAAFAYIAAVGLASLHDCLLFRYH